MLLRNYYVANTVLCTPHVLSHLILMTLGCRYHCYPHLQRFGKVTDLPMVTNLTYDIIGIQTQGI